jgi:hypothetical protein
MVVMVTDKVPGCGGILNKILFPVFNDKKKSKHMC